jgi:hypothetical protein
VDRTAGAAGGVHKSPKGELKRIQHYFGIRCCSSFKRNRSQGCKVRCASNHLIVRVYRVLQMQGVGRVDVLLYFKCPTTKQMRCTVNPYT